MKKSFSIFAAFVFLLLFLSIGFSSCSQMGLKNELAKYYQSDWSRLSDNYPVAHFKALILEHLDTMENCPYPIATERSAIAEKLANRYCEELLYANLAEIALPYIEKHLSVVEMKKINAAIKDDDLRLSIVKISEIMKGEFMLLVNTVTGSAVADIVNGVEPAIPVLSDKVAADYLPVVENFYEVSGRKTIVENSFYTVNEMMNSGAQESQTLAENFFAYLGRTTPVIMSMAMVDNVTKEELQSLIEVFERPEFVKLRNANVEFLQEMVTADENINKLFKEWLEKQL